MTALGFTALGAVVGFGVLLLIEGARGRQVLPRLDQLLPTGTSRDKFLIWLGLSLVIGVLILLLTRWPVAAVALGVLVFLLPHIYGGRRQQQVYIDRTEAVASWAEMVRDNLAGAAGLEQALLATVPLAPAPIRQAVERLEARLDRQVPLVDALAAMSDELDHPSADLVIVAIAKASRMEVRELSPLLTRLAQSIRDDVQMRLRVEVSRARIRQSARIVVGFTSVFVVLLYIFARNLLRPYDELQGQLWLCVVVAVFVAAGWLIYHYSKLEVPVRFAIRRTGLGQGGGS